jgi:hypothetical protein
VPHQYYNQAKDHGVAKYFSKKECPNLLPTSFLPSQ